jgi:hypothetical protein
MPRPSSNNSHQEFLLQHCETQGVGKSDEKGWNVQIMPEKVVFRGSDNLHHFDSESNSTY